MRVRGSRYRLRAIPGLDRIARTPDFEAARDHPDARRHLEPEHRDRAETETAHDFQVADLSLAAFGRKEIELAEHEMPGLMATRERVRRLRSRWPAPGSRARCT